MLYFIVIPSYLHLIKSLLQKLLKFKTRLFLIICRKSENGLAVLCNFYLVNVKGVGE